MCLLQEADAPLLEVPHEHSPLAGSLLRALVNEPAEVPTCDLSRLEPLPQPPGSELLGRDATQDPQPRGSRRCSASMDSTVDLLPGARRHGKAGGSCNGARIGRPAGRPARGGGSIDRPLDDLDQPHAAQRPPGAATRVR
eukprot:6487183-Alexandrium_andersonii.AAC.2